ncbi:hypothetical protein ACP4OV_014754 [Aristida adscensionis]
MVDLSREVQWWEEWQLRILVLGSLFLQFVLFIASFTRLVRLPSLFKRCTWLAYLGSDALAIYALSTLFNRHKIQSSAINHNGFQLEVLWAPVLLLHLGGLHTFTAYSIEDNELWGRHIVTLVSQVIVGLYVFCRSWSGGDQRLLQAAILLFIAGILKFIQKPLALKAASFNGLMSSSFVYPQRRAYSKIGNVCLFCLRLGSQDVGVSLREQEEHDLSLEQYVQEARKLIMTKVDPNNQSDSNYIRDMMKQFADISYPYSHRLIQMPSFLKLSPRDAVRELRDELGFSFSLIYTNFRTAMSIHGVLFMLLLPLRSLASAILFGQSHKDGYKENDVKVTYILLWCTTLLVFLPSLLCSCVIGTMIRSLTAAQHNIISFSTRAIEPTKLMRFSAMLCCSSYINKHWYIQQASNQACIDVIQLVAEHLQNGWKEYIVDGVSYKRFNNLRGRWAMDKGQVYNPKVLGTLQLAFDQSVLVWHLATEFCLHNSETSPAAAGDQGSSTRQCSKVISDYMIYLLLIRPEMLMPGTRQGLFTITSDDIEVILKHVGGPPLLDGRSVAQRILHVAQSPSLDDSHMGPWVLKACKLAEDLMELLAEEERWLVIQGVWVEMLCYSAGRCRGYFHAKSMGEGVEFLSYIWLLLSRMGMETLADKFQRSEPAEGEEIEQHVEGEEIEPGNSASQSQVIPIEEEISITVD